MSNPNDISDAEIRDHIVRILQRGREEYARQAERNRLTVESRDRVFVTGRIRREAEQWADMSDRYVAEFDRAITAVEREFAGETGVIGDLDRFATSLDALAERCANGPQEGPLCWLRLTASGAVAKTARTLRGRKWRAWLLHVLQGLGEVSP